MSIKIDPDSNKYDLAEMRFDKETIIAEEFEYEISTENETKPATNSRAPIGYKGGSNEISWSASGIPMEYYDLLREYQRKRKNFPTNVFNFGDDGDYNELCTLLHCRVNSVTVSHSDEGMSLDTEGIALDIKD